jgi:hypothetical protein
MITEKWCKACERVKTVSEFNKDNSLSSGLGSYCKDCRQQNRKRLSAVCSFCRKPFRMLPSVLDDSGIHYCSISCARKARRPKVIDQVIKRLQIQCRDRMRTLVRSNKLIKPNVCSKCGRVDVQIDGHHLDYTRPNVVIWLCRPCHHDLHVILRQEENVVYA